MNFNANICRTIVALCIFTTLLSCAPAMIIGDKWLDSKTEKSELNVAGTWTSPEWGSAQFKQKDRNITGVIGDYPVKGVVSGNNLYLIMYWGDKIDYFADLKTSDMKTFQGLYSKKAVIDEVRNDPAFARPMSLKLVPAP